MKNLTPKQAIRATEWFKAVYKLQDWAIRIHICDDPPGWCGDVNASEAGAATWSREDKTASVWVSNPRNKMLGWCPIHTFFHELAHVWFADMGIADSGKDDALHCGVDRTGYLCALAYKVGVKHG